MYLKIFDPLYKISHNRGSRRLLLCVDEGTRGSPRLDKNLSRYRERGGDKISAKRKDIQIKNKRRYSLCLQN